ncbi:MAG: hypothetical protein AAGL98_10195 [Planctomycetota bacterium]
MNASTTTTTKSSPALTGGVFFCARVLAICVASILLANGCVTDTGRTVGVPVPAAAVMQSSRVMIEPSDLQLMLSDPRLVLLHVGHGDRG